MKNQYFGDINDYRKYGLLRLLTRESGLASLVAWMLTPADGRTDGRFTAYLCEPKKWSRFDPELFDQLRAWISQGRPRRVTHIESSGLLRNTAYFSETVPDGADQRDRWTDRLAKTSGGRDLVFLDPDNGFEIRSTGYGTRGSSKYVFWREIRRLHAAGRSLLIYQHFPRVKRDRFIADRARMLIGELGVDRVTTFRTSNVLFLLAAQPIHRRALDGAGRSVADMWSGQIGVTHFDS